MKNPIRFLLYLSLIVILLLTTFPGKVIGLSMKDQSLPDNDLALVQNVYLPMVVKNANFTQTLTIWADPTRYALMQQIAAGFESLYNVDVIVEEVANIRDRFVVDAPAGIGPDITFFPHDQMGYLIATDLLAPIDFGALETDFNPTSVDAVKVGNISYGLPYAVENLAFFYNTDLVSTPPTSWVEVHTVGQSLQTSGDVTWGFAFSGQTYDVYPLMTAHGGYVFGRNPDNTWNTDDLGIASSGMIDFGESAKTWLDEGFLSTDLDWNNAHTLFETGEVPWLMAGPWALERIKNSGINYGITSFPSGYSFSGVQAFVINANSKEKGLAEFFLKEYIATTDVMLTLYEGGDRPPAYIPALNLITDPDMIAFGQAGFSAEPMPNIPEMGCVWTYWGIALNQIFNGEKTPAEAYTEAAAAIRNCIDNPLDGMVNVPGSYQSEVGCSMDWDPACVHTALLEDSDGFFRGVFSIPAGNWECKVALNGSWDINYGVGGVPDGPNYSFSTPAEVDVTFVYHPDSHILDIIIGD